MARGDEDTVEPPPRGFCSTALQALRGRQYVAVLLFYLLNLFYRCMQSWRNAELKWKDQQITEAGGQGLDVILQLNTFTSMGASIHLVVIPIFGWLVARFGSDHAPVVVSTGRLAGLEAYPHRLDPAHLQCPRPNTASVLPQHLLRLCVHNVPAGGLRDACRAATTLRRRIILSSDSFAWTRAPGVCGGFHSHDHDSALHCGCYARTVLLRLATATPFPHSCRTYLSWT